MEKSAEAFRTISEVSELLQTPAHVLRFWESRFSQVKPVKRAGGRRYYRPSDLALLGGIKRLLHEDGMTIRGVQKVLRKEGVRHVASLSPVEPGLALDADAADATPKRATPPAAKADAADLFAEARPAPDSNITPLWPDAPSPDAAEGGDTLLPDPEDLATPVAAEAPMMLDAEPAPEPAERSVHALAGGSPLSAPGAADDARAPAATLLRAMDALRAHDKRSELASVYERLHALRDRVARADGSGRD
jgi:DNA-binding transcriptional MerR regulator